MKRRNIKLVLAYDGTGYCGWQRQKNGLSIQEVIETRIELMMGGHPRLLASGRTDAGVHAFGQVCNFKTDSGVSLEAMKKGLNSLLPEDILIREVEDVSPDFHARYDARSKTYAYKILNRPEPDIFRRNYQWHVRRPLDIGAMKKCLSFCEGTHDFSAFRSSGSGNVNPVRTINQAELMGPSEDDILTIAFEADGFLRHMVRNVVGTVVDVGIGRMDEKRFSEVLDTGDRQGAGFKAPPQGLYLVEVKY